MKTRVGLRRFRRLSLLVALLFGAILALTVMSAIALSASPARPEDVPGMITGTLYEPGGTVPSGGWIDIHDSAAWNVAGWCALSQSSFVGR